MKFTEYLNELNESRSDRLNEDQRTDLIQEISDRLQTLGVDPLKEILDSLKTQEEKKFTGEISASSITGSSLHAGDSFDDYPGLKAKLTRIDPNDRKKVEKLLKDHYWRGNKVKFIRSEKKCDVYHCIGKSPDHPLVVYLYRE